MIFNEEKHACLADSNGKHVFFHIFPGSSQFTAQRHSPNINIEAGGK